jgi:hypothetical protein
MRFAATAVGSLGFGLARPARRPARSARAFRR